MSLIVSRSQWPAGMMLQPPLVSGRFYAAPQGYGQIATNAPGINWHRIYPWLQPHSATWATIGVETTIASGAGGVCRIAYYRPLEPLGAAELVRDFGTVALDAAAGFQGLTVNEHVAAGYWLIALFSSVAAGSATLRVMIGQYPQYGQDSGADSSPGNHLAFLLTSTGFDVQMATLAAPARIRIGEETTGSAARVLIGI